ncbi:hypothetical protein Slin15195_G122720 [Septoria linicola]|uniref:Uncharacterized protein n=1 Tax=Septoria linicola TaxID=215465 RepID=A0A9Q9ERV3_9PEZI|nr:hypothetical protein Slin14017_G078920 [Septoria linicola]USW58953.1 hypothetical protein Slin15195_G122720 [Septoria linicola]
MSSPKVQKAQNGPQLVQTISFFNLSAELRNKIYECCLTAPLTIKRNSPRSQYTIQDDDGAESFDVPQLLSVCRQINQEATDIFYSSKTIIFEARGRGWRNVDVIQQAASIKHIWHVEIVCVRVRDDLGSVLDSLKAVTWLRSLRLQSSSPFSLEPEEIAPILKPLMMALMRSGRTKLNCIEILQFFPQPLSETLESHRVWTNEAEEHLEVARRVEQNARYQEKVRDHLNSILPSNDEMLVAKLKISSSKLQLMK